MQDVHRTWLATSICCVGVVSTALFFENSVFSLAIAAAVCIGSLSYRASAYGSRIKAARLFLLNAGLLTLIFVPLRLTLSEAWLPMDYFSWWPHRIYRVWSLSERSAIILVFVAAGLVTIEAAGKIGGDLIRNRFQWSTIAAGSVLVAVNVAHFFRPVWCHDCFFPYGLPFTLFTEGGYGGGGGFVWTGLVADAALIPAFATVSALLARNSRAWYRPSWWNLLVALPWALGLAFLIHESITESQVAEREQPTSGIVTAHEPSNHNRYGYRFEVDGRAYTGWQSPKGEELAIGKQVIVFYDPQNPGRNALTDFHELRASSLGPVPMLLFGIGAVAVFIHYGHRRTKTTPG